MKYMLPSQFANIFLTYQTFVTNLHLLKVELRCKLQEKMHRVTGPKLDIVIDEIFCKVEKHVNIDRKHNASATMFQNIVNRPSNRAQ